jgi:Domain of unknown function (DUF4291)
MAEAGIPERQVRALFDDETITVYQAYAPEIAEAALAAGRFVAPFKRDRMTWIKPSFLWMMHRSGWATKPGQERVLAVRIRRDGFEWALRHSSPSHDAARKHACPVRVQWDPERSLQLAPLGHRAIQVGIGGEAVGRYVDEWITGLSDVTPLAHAIHELVEAEELDAARGRLPLERAYELPADLRAVVGG